MQNKTKQSKMKTNKNKNIKNKQMKNKSTAVVQGKPQRKFLWPSHILGEKIQSWPHLDDI